MNDRKIKYVDLNGLQCFAEELKRYLDSHVREYSIYEELLERIQNLENDIENYTFYEVVESYDKLLELDNPQKNIIYLVPDDNNFLEYIWTDNKYEQLGSFTPELKLDDYLKKEDSPFEKGQSENSAVLKGGNNQATNANEVAFGKYNKSDSDTCFSIGIGTSDTERTNAVEVKQNGDVYITSIGGYDGTNSTESEDVASAIKDLVKISYTELVNLKSSSKLVSGRFYRITDYITTTKQVDTQSAVHPFDVIVLALSDSELSDKAWVIQSERDTDGYFANSKLEAWQIWYCLDNDAERFAWADTANGKGVIYRMIDEWNNDVPYDFKNIQFKHPNNPTNYPYYYYTFSLSSGGELDYSLYDGSHCYGNKIGQYISGGQQLLNQNIFINTSALSYCHSNTFGNFCHHNTFHNDCYSNSFGNDCYSNSFGVYCYSNIFGNACYSNIFSNSCYYNTFGNNCYSNTFGTKCSSISFGNNCYLNTFGDNCYYNSFGNYCHDNSFGNNSHSNSFGNTCQSNTFGDDCYYNSFGNTCRSNTFGKGCYINSFGNSCTSNTFGNYCVYNTFGNSCQSNRFGITASTSNYYAGNSFGDDVRNITLTNDLTASGNNRVQYYRVANGMQGQGGSLIIEVERNKSIETYIGKNTDGEIKQLCLADMFDALSQITISETN